MLDCPSKYETITNVKQVENKNQLIFGMSMRLLYEDKISII